MTEAEQGSNIERALKACRILAMMGIQPLAPHLYFTRFLKDDVAAERAAGMQFGLSWLEQADELWVLSQYWSAAPLPYLPSLPP